MADRYAAGTTVPDYQSRLEIDRTLQRYGADQFVSGWDAGRAMIAFRLHGRFYRLVLPLPRIEEYAKTPETRKARSATSQQEAWEQACRQRWRALALVVKANLEAVEAGIVTVEQAFLGATVLPDNSTVQDWLGPQVTAVYQSGKMPELLPGLPALTNGR